MQIQVPEGSSLRIALVQMRCEKAAIDQNLRIMSDVLGAASRRTVDIVAFPEMSITGYADPTRYPQAVLTLDCAQVNRFLEITRDFPGIVLAGLIEANPGGKPFITQIIAHQRQLAGLYRKITIEDEELLWFSPGQNAAVFDHNRQKFGLAICADIHNESVFRNCVHLGARIIFELAAPGLYGDQATRNWKSGFDWWKGECQKFLGSYAGKYKCWIAVATQAGRTIDEDFPGGGYVFAPDGSCLYATPDGLPGIVFLTIDLQSNKLSLQETLSLTI